MTKVLVIDDEAQIRRFLRAGFELHGFSVIEAENAAAGLKAATMGAVDLIILDLNLPDLEGSEVLERIRSWSNIPVIVLSIHTDEHEKVRLLRLGQLSPAPSAPQSNGMIFSYIASLLA